MRALAAAGLAALAVVLAAAGGASADVRLQHVGDFDSPVHVAGAPGDDERLYVVEQPGIIRVVRDGTSSVFADLTGPVAYPGGEDGLLSIAFAPDFQTSRLLYVFFTNTDADPNAGDGPDLEIAELRAPTGDAVDPLSLRTVLRIPHDENNNHNGGLLQFGPDGFLYISTGDGGGSYDEPVDDAIRTDSLLGKLLRIDPRATATGDYTVPADNPFGNEVWSYGLRNPWRFSFAPSTGDLIVADVGQDTVEELNHMPASTGAGRGAHFGWDECEGNFDVKPPDTGGGPCTLQGDVRPAVSLLHPDFCSVIGGYVVRDPSLPSLLGRYVYSDFCRGRLRSVLLEASGASGNGDIDPPLDVSHPTSFGEDAAGCLYVVSREGAVYRLVEQDAGVPCAVPPGGTPPAGPTPGGSDAGGADTTDDPVDRAGPQVAARVKRRQRVLRLGGAVAYVRCDELCAITAGGWLRIAGRTRVYRMRRTVQGAQATRRHRVKVRLTRRGRHALQAALAEGRAARLRVGLRARDAAGNRSALTRFTVRATG